jgi:small GTP-binding protein
MFGLDRAGKTILTNFLVTGATNKQYFPTIAPSMQLLVVKQLKSRIWDMPGQIKFRDMWFKYVMDSNLLICVVDMADYPRFSEAYQELINLLNHVMHHTTEFPPLLICLHKVDLPEAQAHLLEAKKVFDVSIIYRAPIFFIETSIKNRDSLQKLKDKVAELIEKATA